ncbi:hypothetical protein IMG5_023250 [Ichthyophthirius multifiliis]|uniref:Large ribosomal subunit protein uL3m n=1 Tax=Ichthyophthirius multifiliis TaxID=5932 RepID=G0QKZ0_ICHMU|nr:hypothetical protein IMG5_023250 [Ichthyophthirius multifiliis]EGR34111.1 hypothetical protein IMG5_023250 [Ichthyophthirius multifiliis]|eukprot:XP_004039415.1 hypothetical protein IMG5_023250 [Ichthyophthirius multifiliis]
MIKLLQKYTKFTNTLPTYISFNFSKWSKPKKSSKPKQRKVGYAISDEKAAKLSQSENEIEQKKAKEKALQTDQFKPEKHIKTQIADYDQQLTDDRLFSLLSDYNFRFQGKRLVQPKKTPEQIQEFQKIEEKKIIYPNPNSIPQKQPPGLFRKADVVYFNPENLVNQKFKSQLKPISPTKTSKRTGVLGYKLGMTSIWDKWGTLVPLTVIQLDRCQVVQVKTEEKEGYNALQLGIGELNPKRIKKPQIGHFMKSNIPSKKDLTEFKVSKDCLLPPGFMLSARHFTPGQLVDVSGISVGKGFQGCVKRWNFKMQDATHGNSLSHRVPGSTGQRQDPGRVFKQKKMPGRMGFKKVNIHNLQVYKIDVENSLVYIRGNVPGKPGTCISIKDALLQKDFNNEFLNFPTFIEMEDVKLANVIVANPPEKDPSEEYIHDNDVID